MKVVSLFNGMGCGYVSLKDSNIPIEEYHSFEIDKYAIEAAKILSDGKIIEHGSVVGADFSKFKDIDIVIGGSPCFVGGTSVRTEDGYVNIEDIKIGDKVLTHKNRFRKVLKIGNELKNTYLLKPQGILETETTENHPYYVVSKPVHYKSTPYWKNAGELTKNDYVGFPINGESKNPYNLTKEEAWLIGRYIADGHTRKDFKVSEGRPSHRNWQVIYSIGISKLKTFKSSVKEINFSSYPHIKSVYRNVISSKRLVEIVEKECGKGAKNKHISETLLNLPRNLLIALITGYLAGDGSERRGIFKATTISKKLAMSLCIAIPKALGVHANIEFTKRPKTTVIEGRTVNQNDTYTISFRYDLYGKAKAIIQQEGYVWLPVKKFKKTGDTKRVYNLEVEEDNSYTANNAVVHNCQGFSFAGKQLAFDDPRSKLFFEFVRAVAEIRPKYFLLENVKMKKEHLDVISEFMGVKPVFINSALLTAQNRQRFYWCNWNVEQPKDRGILLKDIIETGDADREKSLAVTARIAGATAKRYLEKSQHQMIIESQFVDRDKSYAIDANYAKGGSPEQYFDKSRRQLVFTGGAIRGRYNSEGKVEQQLEIQETEKANSITTVSKDSLLVEAKPRENRNMRDLESKSKPLMASRHKGTQSNGMTNVTDGISWRKLTPKECLRLQGFSETDIDKLLASNISNSQLYKMTGNGWTVPVISHIFNCIKNNA